MQREFHRATADDICSEDEPFPLVEAKFQGQLGQVSGRGEDQGMLREARAGTSRSKHHSGPCRRPEGPWREGPSGIWDKHHIPFHLWAFLTQSGPVTGCAQWLLISPLGAQAQSQPRSVQSLHVGKDRRRPCSSNAVPVLGSWQEKATQNPSGLFGNASHYLYEVLFKMPEDVKEWKQTLLSSLPGTASPAAST